MKKLLAILIILFISGTIFPQNAAWFKAKIKNMEIIATTTNITTNADGISDILDGTIAKYRAPLTTGVLYGADTQAGTKWVPVSIVPDSTWTISEGIIGGVY